MRKRTLPQRRPPRHALLLLGMALLLGCGGGGGGGGSAVAETARTTFAGNLADDAVSAGETALAGPVEVCIEGTAFCTTVAADGFFTLAGDVGGDVVLILTAPDFTVRVPLTDVPLGATVRLSDIRCSTLTGLCHPDVIDITGGLVVRGPLRCGTGVVRVAHDGDLVIDGRGEPCVRAEGNCDLTIEAASLTLENCEQCVRALGGSLVVLGGFVGDLECEAFGDGIEAGGSAAVVLDAANVFIRSLGGSGIHAHGTALVELAGGVCFIEGADVAIREDGDARVVTDGCVAVDLVDGPGFDDDDSDSDDLDGDDGEDSASADD